MFQKYEHASKKCLFFCATNTLPMALLILLFFSSTVCLHFVESSAIGLIWTLTSLTFTGRISVCSWVWDLTWPRALKNVRVKLSPKKNSRIIHYILSMCLLISACFCFALIPFNQTVEAHGSQLCISISQIKYNNEKIPPCLGGFKKKLYLEHLMLCSSSELLSTLLS